MATESTEEHGNTLNHRKVAKNAEKNLIEKQPSSAG
jgi:hypothetical protein